jgi:hypothetical protein
MPWLNLSWRSFGKANKLDLNVEEEPVVAEQVMDPIDLDALFEHGALRVVLELVGHQHGQRVVKGVLWLNAVLEKLNDMGMKTVWDFVSSVLMVNSRLFKGSHWQIHTATLTAMLHESCEMMFGSEDVEDEAEEVSSWESQAEGW